MPSSRVIALWLAATLLYLASLEVNGQQVGTACTQPRIRKSWDSLSADDKAQYIEAVGMAMDRGFHQKFVQIHTEQLTGLEAHQSCVFIYWHRMLLLGYENMLRSLNPAYQCITLPYWDHLSGSARQASNNCSSIEGCSSIIADFGGTTTGVSKSLSVYGSSIPNSIKTICVTQGLSYRFCGNNTGCAHCILRTRSKYLSATTYPNEASFGSVYQQVFTYSDSGSFTSAVERGIHNTVHNALGGVMTYLQAPIDPVFNSHHSLIDLLQTIYLKCQIGDEKVFLSAENKSSDPRVWTSCTRSNGGNFRASDNITMRALANDGKTFVNVWQDPNNILYPFFKDMPYQYADYVDAKDLKTYSYTYDISGGLANMYQNCKDSNTFCAISLLADSRQSSKKKKEPLLPTISEGTDDDDAVRLWHVALFEAAQIVGFQDWAARDQMEMIACVHHGECIGPIDDYTNLFRTNFGVKGHTRCFSILQDIMDGTRIIGIPMWREITSRFLPCPLQDGDDSDSEGGSEAAVA
ncbi:hypothetical protein PF005_g29140 [Phytophthora fragariae]|uniref:Tyrosinase copper-binding domain-containing protein n=1 Tax=Phytophthora fragariae TaxID=53985 RepID=A0A6A3DNP7_9STRA|nr:hypothetical protein PF003_g38344 [Phytophthora fragariae]KAE8923724.1 hypothetical protein PF009_g26030 [Phytophthora fragariae]KAE9073457.1 hypothetical protein PF007_g25799 [Phytophthora fragariae]KAE9092526.1 hypothetical protein PF006_g24666 [Phytophthora fragariae]KAE9166596.1 hypothetical protein PF005_g29140 [Phytophthora fragariae]